MEVLPALRSIFIALSPDLLAMLSIDIDNGLGVVALVGAAALAGLTGSGIASVSPRDPPRGRLPERLPSLSPGSSRN